MLGNEAALVMPWCDTYAMTQHLTETARHVEESMGDTRIKVEDSGRIVRQAVEAMGEIEASAGHISQIISVIWSRFGLA